MMILIGDAIGVTCRHDDVQTISWLVLSSCTLRAVGTAMAAMTNVRSSVSLVTDSPTQILTLIVVSTSTAVG
jgi:hypothetical protein